MVRLAELLVEAGLIDVGTMERAYQRPRTRGQKMAEVLLEMGAVTHEQLRSVLTSRVVAPVRRARIATTPQARAAELGVPI